MTTTLKPHYWRLAWVAFLAAIPLRLYFFAGWGLGDDYVFANDLHAILAGGFSRHIQAAYRVAVMLPVVLGSKLLGVNEFSFVLPVFLYALGSHLIAIYFSRDALGERAAFLCSLIFLVTPFETLASTAFCPDYGVGFYGILAAWSIYRGLRDSRSFWMWLGGMACALGVLSKFSAIFMLPVVALAVCTDLKKWRFWLPVFAPTLLLMSGASVASSFCFGTPLAWMQYAFPFQGYPRRTWLDIRHTLNIYPQYLLFPMVGAGRHSLMFGLTGWAALGGLCFAFWSILRKRQTWVSSIVLLMFCYLLIFNFAPHKLTLSAYYSHPRIFRYLTTVSPFIYFAAAFFFEMLLRSQRKVVQGAGVLMLSFALLVNAASIRSVSEPSWDPNRDGRLLTSFLSKNIPAGSVIQADIFTGWRINSMLDPTATQWRLNSVSPASNKEKEDYFKSRTNGYIITGGGTLAWYSCGGWVLNLSETAFKPNHGWKLIYESPITTPASWRKEPYRIWQIIAASTNAPIVAAELADSEIARSIAGGVSNRVVYVDGYHAVVPADLAESRGSSDGLLGKLGLRHTSVFAAAGAKATAVANQGFVESRDELFRSGLLVMQYGMHQREPDAAEYAVVRRYIANGGRVLLLCPAWVWEAYDKKPLCDLPYDVIGREFGLSMDTAYVKRPLKAAHPKWGFGGFEGRIEGTFSAIICTSTNATPILVGSDGKAAAVAATKGNARIVLWAQDNLLGAKTTANPNARKGIVQMLNWLLEPTVE